jgi:putative membrane protein
MVKASVLGITIGAALLCSVSGAPAADKATEMFLTKAIQGNMAEVKVGQLAEQKGQSEETKKFGQMLQKDHSEANQKAMEVAKQMGVTPPNEPSAQQKSMYDKLSNLSGAAFDREFAKEMVEDHQKVIKGFENEAKKNDAAGQFAKETLPHLKMHLQMAESLSKSAPSTVGSGKRK